MEQDTMLDALETFTDRFLTKTRVVRGLMLFTTPPDSDAMEALLDELRHEARILAEGAAAWVGMKVR